MTRHYGAEGRVGHVLWDGTDTQDNLPPRMANQRGLRPINRFTGGGCGVISRVGLRHRVCRVIDVSRGVFDVKSSIIIFLAVSAVVVAVGARGEQPPVYSVNMMGLQHIELPASALNLAAVPYARDADSINDVLDGQLTAGADLNTGDVAYFFDAAAQAYRLAYLYTDGTNTYWIDNQSQTPATNRIAPGVGFWIRSHQASNQSAAVIGEVISDPAVSTPVVNGLQLLAYPYPTSYGISDLALSNNATRGEAPDSADTLYLWDCTSQSFKTYYFYTDGSLIDYSTGNPATNTLAPGEAFWYRHVGGGFSWVEAKPYAWP